MRFIQEIYDVLSDYKYVYSVCLERDLETNKFNLKIQFSNCPDYYTEKISIVFSGVQQFEMKNLDGLLCARIVVRDIGDRQLEKLNYFIKEEEEDMFSFYCSSINIVYE